MSYKLLLWQLGFTGITAADKLRFILSLSVFMSIQSRLSSLFFGCFYFRMRGDLLEYRKMSIFRRLWCDLMENSWRNPASRYRDNAYAYDK